ncbi:DUF805 domain-containing protein [Bartonella sp. HY328]|uniref:DUF805 domain-containing protein n=1 Tax=unclassified Bartonella TaxID=2645622 RepID=UPI003965AF17
MEFKTAIYTCLRLKYADFNSRASRSEYWWFTLFNLISLAVMVIISAILASLISSSEPDSTRYITFLPSVWFIWFLAIIIPSLAVSVRRLHDVNRSGWWILFYFTFQMLPLIGVVFTIIYLILLCKPGHAAPNRFGNNPYAITYYQNTFQ